MVIMEKMDEDERSKQDKILLQPFHYITQIPGKLIRAKLAQAFNLWLNIEEDKLNVISEALQILHNASLLIDDIEDNSHMRRGVPGISLASDNRGRSIRHHNECMTCGMISVRPVSRADNCAKVAHHIYGVATTINAANYAYFLGLEKILQLPNPEVTKVFTEQLLELHRGQGMEIYWRDNFVCPTEDEYRQMVVRKTGGLFGLAVRLMQLFSQNKNDFTKLSGILGYYFQIRDDYSNLCSKEYTEHKSFCEDLTEGKYSFPIIHAIHNFPDDTRVINILRQRTTDIEIKKYFIHLLTTFGSFEYTRKVLADLDRQAIEEVERLGGNPYLVKILDGLRTWQDRD